MNKQTVQQSTLPQGRIGSVVMWGSASRKVSVDRNITQQEVEKHMGPEYVHHVKEPVNQEAAFRRTMKAMQCGLPSGFFWRSLSDDRDHLKWSYALETKDGKTETYRADGTLSFAFDKRAKVWTASDESHAQADRGRGLYAIQNGNLQQADFAAIIKSIIGTTSGFGINSACYFIPNLPCIPKAGEAEDENGPRQDDWIPGLRKALEHTGIPITWMPIASDQDMVEQYQVPVQVSLLAEVSLLQDEVEEMKAKDPGAITRDSTFQSRIEKATELQNKAIRFEQLLETKLDDVITAAIAVSAEFESLKGSEVDAHEIAKARLKRTMERDAEKMERLERMQEKADTPEIVCFNLLRELSEVRDVDRAFEKCQAILNDPACPLDNLSEDWERKTGMLVKNLNIAAERVRKLGDKPTAKDKRDAGKAFRKAGVDMYRKANKLLD